MIPSYSTLILGEFILLNMDAPFIASGFVWQTMVLHSGMERSEGQRRELISGIGLEMAGFWRGLTLYQEMNTTYQRQSDCVESVESIEIVHWTIRLISI